MKKFKSLFLVFGMLITFTSIQLNGQGTTCATAVSITPDGACSAAITMSDATIETVGTPAPSCSAAILREYWYSFTISGGPKNVTIVGTASNRNLVLQALSGSCGTLTQIGCIDANTTAGAQTETLLLNNVANGTYYIRVGNTTNSNMSLTSICITTVAAAPINDQCTGAITATCGNTYTGNTSSATSTNDPTGTCGTDAGTPGVWYKFVGNGSDVTASLCASSFDTKINVYSGSCGSYTCIGGNDDGCGSQSTYTFTSVNATTYYIFVGGYSGATGAYSLTLTCCTPSVPGCATSPSIANGATGISTCAPVLSWTAPANSGCNGATSYDVYFGTTAIPPLATNTTATSYTVTTNLNPSTTYYWKIVPKNALGNATGCSTWSFTTNALGCTDNDFCSGATTVTCGGSYTGTTVGATSTNDPTGTCGTNVGAPGRWYVFSGNGDVVTASLCGSGWDTKMNVYSGNCASLTCVGGNDDGASCSASESEFSFGTVAGVNYYIFVNGYSGATGAYTLNITCCTPSAPSCASLTSPANGATGINPCNAILDWAVATGSCGSTPTYDIYFGTNATPPFLMNTSNDQVTIPDALNDNTVYYWKIVPRVGGITASGCPTRSFTTGSKANPYYCLVDDAINYPSGGSNCAQMTPDLASQRGCIWNTGTISFLNSFDYTLNMYFGNDDGGADGCTFVFQNAPAGIAACGTDGVQLGAGGIPNAIVVEFDTYDNGSEDPTYDHTAIYTNGDLSGTPLAGPVQADPNDLDLEDGIIHALRVTWDAATHNLCVYVDGSQRLCATNDFVNTVFGGNPNVAWGFTGSTGAYSNQQYFCPIAIPLPVVLQRYDVDCKDSKTVLNWQTASEVNNAYFVIEKSSDTLSFETAGVVTGSGNSNSVKKYSFTDNHSTSNMPYYRLVQVDYDGKATNLGIRYINCLDKSNELNILSVVKQNATTIDIVFNTPFVGSHSIELLDANSRVISSVMINTETGVVEQQLDVTESLSPGVYYIKIANNKEAATHKVYFNK